MITAERLSGLEATTSANLSRYSVLCRVVETRYIPLFTIGFADGPEVHSRFPVDQDEMLLETLNKHERTLTIRPVKRDDVGKAVMGRVHAVQSEMQN